MYTETPRFAAAKQNLRAARENLANAEKGRWAAEEAMSAANEKCRWQGWTDADCVEFRRAPKAELAATKMAERAAYVTKLSAEKEWYAAQLENMRIVVESNRREEETFRAICDIEGIFARFSAATY